LQASLREVHPEFNIDGSVGPQTGGFFALSIDDDLTYLTQFLRNRITWVFENKKSCQKAGPVRRTRKTIRGFAADAGAGGGRVVP